MDRHEVYMKVSNRFAIRSSNLAGKLEHLQPYEVMAKGIAILQEETTTRKLYNRILKDTPSISQEDLITDITDILYCRLKDVIGGMKDEV